MMAAITGKISEPNIAATFAKNLFDFSMEDLPASGQHLQQLYFHVLLYNFGDHRHHHKADMCHFFANNLFCQSCFSNLS
jgi:hypothetical protein